MSRERRSWRNWPCSRAEGLDVARCGEGERWRGSGECEMMSGSGDDEDGPVWRAPRTVGWSGEGG